MNKLWFIIAALLLSMQLAADTLPYDEHADAGKDVARALAEARAGGKQTLIVFGANWCADCRKLDKILHEKNGPLGEDRYVIVKVDVGNFDKNIALAGSLGNPIKKGIPGAAVVTPENRVQYAGPLSHLLMPHRRWLKLALAAAAITGLIVAANAVLLRRFPLRIMRGNPARARH